MEDNKKVIFAGAAVICLVVLAIIVYYFFLADRGPKEQDVVTQPVETSKTESVQEEVTPKAEIETIQVDLDKSDDIVRELAGKLSSHVQFPGWLTSGNIIRKFTAAVDNIANGESPEPNIDFFEVKGKFKIEWKSGKAYIDPSIYSRYNVVADIFNSLDTTSCTKLFLQLKPACQEAYSELGYPDADFQKTLEKAISHLLAVPVVEDDVEVEKEVVSYIFADQRLENLTDAQKHLFRMGPENVKIIQDKLRDFAAGLAQVNNPG
jgi:hypothetical protein